MGACVSTADRAGKARSDEIDKQLEEDHKRLKRECKILLLGESSFPLLHGARWRCCEEGDGCEGRMGSGRPLC